MNLFDQISNDIKEAMKAREKVRLEALRGVKKELLEAKTSKGSDGEISDEDGLKIIQKLVKQRKDSADVYLSQDRKDLAEKELEEVQVLSVYLPAQMSDAELEVAVKLIIESTGATSMKEMGKVMGIASKQLSGKADGKKIADTVKRLLS